MDKLNIWDSPHMDKRLNNAARRVQMGREEESKGDGVLRWGPQAEDFKFILSFFLGILGSQDP